jgi:SAM-dependent methyltransferase
MSLHRDEVATDPRVLQVHREPPKRDVPYVPTDEPVVAAMLRFAGVGPNDVVYDLGCGDGRIVIAAAKHCGARGVGVDIDPQRIHESRENARNARVADRVRFECKSLFDTDVRDATIVMLYLLPSINLKLRPKFLTEMKPGSKIVANYFDMGDWKPDMQASAHHRTLHQWIVPAAVAGTWRCTVNLPGGRRSMILHLRRRFQTVTGTVRVGRHNATVASGRLFGDRLTFKLLDLRLGQLRGFYACKVEGRYLHGTHQTDAIETHPIPWAGVLKPAAASRARALECRDS